MSGSGAPRVAILGHAADRTGPPMHLLELLRARDAAVEAGGAEAWDLDIIVLRGGELEDELGRHGRLRVIGEAPAEREGRGPTATEAARIDRERARELRDLRDLDLVIVNTAWSAHALAWLPPGDHAVVTMIHELGAGLERALRPDLLQRVLADSDRITVGCEAVRRHLTERLGVVGARIETIPYIAAPGPEGGPRRLGDVGAPDDPVLVTAAGVTDRRKGPDLFVHLAAATRRRHPRRRWRFQWIGAADPTHPDLLQAQSDARRIGPDGDVEWAPPTSTLRTDLTRADIFVVCSREDAYPLVALEAAAAARPIVVFSTVGTAELLDDGAGVVIGYPDVDAMADALAELAGDPPRRHALGQMAADRVLDRHAPAGAAAALDRVAAVLLRERSQR